jgi:hypothetical protein
VLLVLIQRSDAFLECQQTLVDFRSFHPTRIKNMRQYQARAFVWCDKQFALTEVYLVFASVSPRSAPRSLPARSIKLNLPTTFRLWSLSTICIMA